MADTGSKISLLSDSGRMLFITIRVGDILNGISACSHFVFLYNQHPEYSIKEAHHA